MVRVAIDVMGGDHGAESTIAGLSSYISKNGFDGVAFDLFGDRSIIEAQIGKFPNIPGSIYEIYNTGSSVISPDMKPSAAVRGGRGTSMFEAILHVADKKAGAVVSSGNTGAYMALAKIILKTMVDVERPALISILPNVKGKSVMLDLGANTECSSTNLIQFAIMGAAAAKVLLKVDNPSVGLLNVGTEKGKGTDSLKGAYEFLENSKDINFVGFIEGTDITKGTADVIVTDGFSGNISLKTMEGTIRFLVHLFKEGIKSSILGKIGFLFCLGMLSRIKNKMDPSRHNGASLVGLDGIAIKSHGSSDAVGFASAISVAVELARSNFIKNLKEAISSSEMEKTHAYDNN